MSSIEPGLDRHDWETEWQQLEPLVVDSPGEALPELDDLVARMMSERGYPTVMPEDEARARELDQPEILAEFLEARRVAKAVEAGEDVDPGDIGAAISGYRNLYEFLLSQMHTA